MVRVEGVVMHDTVEAVPPPVIHRQVEMFRVTVMPLSAPVEPEVNIM